MKKNSNSECSQSSWIRGKCIGQGNFGTVNIGVRISDGKVFAVKSVDLATCLPGQAEALENEIQILRSLSSPYVVKYLGNDQTASSCRNLHMEYMTNGTTADVAEEESVVQSWTWCVVSALKYLHSRGVVHCDVKGSNVLVGPGEAQAKLSDFGTAVDLNSVKCTGRIVPRGSPLWMAPEVIRGEYQGPESDVWSLGCTVIEMATGKPAWEDEGILTLGRVGFWGEVPVFPIRLSEMGRDFLEKCLRRNREERWSCDQLLRHPFLASVTPYMAADFSPRCVLDWVNSEFEDDEYNCSSSHVVSAKARIEELAIESGVEWKFEQGWTVVRGCGVEKELETAAFSREEGDASLGDSDCGGVFWERENSGGGEIVERGARNECDAVGGSGWGCSSVMEYLAEWDWSVGKRSSKSLNYHSRSDSCTIRLLLSNLFSSQMIYCVMYFYLFFLGYIIKMKSCLKFHIGLKCGRGELQTHSQMIFFEAQSNDGTLSILAKTKNDATLEHL